MRLPIELKGMFLVGSTQYRAVMTEVLIDVEFGLLSASYHPGALSVLTRHSCNGPEHLQTRNDFNSPELVV